MTKIYLVYAKRKGVDQNVVMEVFTNYKLAHAFANYFNAGNKKVFYWVRKMEICKEDYRILPF